MNYILKHKQRFSIKRIERRHKSYRNQELITEKYKPVQRIIILIIIISCIALVAAFLGLF